MFLEQWFAMLERWSFWGALVGYLVGGVSIGLFSWRFRKFFFFVSTFLVLFSGAREKFPGDARLWALFAILVAVVVTLWYRAEKVGQFFSGFWFVLNLASLLLLVSQEVEIIRFLTRIPLRTWSWVALAGGVLALHRYFSRLFGVLLGGILLTVGYLKILTRGNFQESFWGEPPLIAFLFLVVAIVMYFSGEYER
jgi:hypothetical protein